MEHVGSCYNIVRNHRGVLRVPFKLTWVLLKAFMISKVIETLFAKTDLERRSSVLAPLL
jgi:hypothetical protein